MQQLGRIPHFTWGGQILIGDKIYPVKICIRHKEATLSNIRFGSLILDNKCAASLSSYSVHTKAI